ncbi:MAG TPA: hypothetical protein VLV15_15980 [Dongiaceae bacterium]|nr:hypothetical protein [Dongiaceae bacterium]
MDPDTPSALALLERRLRWLTAVCVFLGLGLVLDTAYRLLPAQPELAAQRFTLTDAHGHVRGMIGQWGDGTSLLQLNGPDGRERLILAAGPDGSAGLRILDSSHTHRVFLATDAGGSPTLLLAGSDGTRRLRLVAAPAQAGQVERYDQHGARIDER